MQAVILAAGMGNRLKPLTEDIPKALVEVNGLPILVNSLNILERNNIKKTTIIVGYLGDEIKKKIGNKWKRMDIKYIENKKFKITNNIYSLWLARNILDEDTILMECDIFFEEKLIKRLLHGDLANKVVVDKFKSGMDGTVVEINQNNQITKLITGEDQDINFNYSNKYKTVNVYLFTNQFLKKFFLPYLNLYIKTQSKNKYYELILSIFVNLKNPILQAVIIDDTKWIEIDDFSDLRKAEILTSSPKMKLKEIESIHGGYWNYDFLDFSYLYNMYFPPTQLINEIKLNLNKLISNYPSNQKENTKKLANWVQIKPEFLTVANGASEIIKIINTQITKKIAIPTPTFNEYENSLKKEQIIYFHTESDNFSLKIKKYIKTIKDNQCNVALLINPNNPTGQITPIKDIKKLLNELKDIDLIIIDESFIGFNPPKQIVSIEKYFKQYKNLIIIHSLGKELGILGARLGYTVSVNQKINKIIRKNLPIWNINSVTEYILEILPKYKKEYQKSILNIIGDRNYLYKKLQSIDYLNPFISSANFIFVRLEKTFLSTDLKKLLFYNNNILIKDCSNKTGLENKEYIRIAVKTKQETDILINTLQKITSKKNINWQNIWTKKGQLKNKRERITLPKLLKLNGFNTENGTIKTADWLKYVELISKKIHLHKSKSLLEIGCGAGALLYPIYKKDIIKLSGIDYSKPLLKIAKNIMPKANFKYAEAKKIPFLDNSFDSIVSNSVFIYFPNYKYAEHVLLEILRIMKPKGECLILDINDTSKKYLAEKTRMNKIGKEKYKKMYKDLPQMYFEKEWFEEFAKKHNLYCEITNQDINNYTNSKWRFNVYLKKVI